MLKNSSIGRSLLKNKGPKPSFFVKKGSELSLSSPVFTEILSAVLERGSSLRFLAKGFSMAPFIRDGDVITLSPFREKSPGLGIVVAFFNPQYQKIMVHRIVGKKNGLFLIRGDNSPASDGMISGEHILGYVTKVERRGKNVFLGLGLEKCVISFLSRKGLLIPVLLPLWRIFRFVVPASVRIRGKRPNDEDNNEVFS